MLSMKSIADSQKSAFTLGVICPHCESKTSLDLGPQHRITGRADMHCRKCSRYSSHQIKADALTDAFVDRNKKQREIWRKVPAEAFISCRRGMQGAPFVWTFYSGSGDPIEFYSRDSVEHRLVTDFGFSGAQANSVLTSAALTPGYKIYLQRWTKLSMAAEENLRKKAEENAEVLIKAGSPVKVSGRQAIFLRYSNNQGFVVVAFPGVGDVEVPTIELEVEDVGDTPEDVGFEVDPLEEAAEADVMHEILHEVSIVRDTVDLMLQHELEEGKESGSVEEDEVEVLEEADEGLEQAEEGILEFITDEEDEFEEESEDFDLEEKEGKNRQKDRYKHLLPEKPVSKEEEVPLSYQEFDGEDDDESEKAAKAEKWWQKAVDTVDKLRSGPDPSEIRKRRPWNKKRPQVEEKTSRRVSAEEAIQEKLRNLQTIIQDPNTDPQTLQVAQRKYNELKKSMESRRAWITKTKEELEMVEPESHEVPSPESDEIAEKSEMYPKSEKSANVAAQRKVHTHYSHSKDLKRAISANRSELSIADIRDILAFYEQTSKISSTDSEDMARWFIGDRPILLSASSRFEEWQRNKEKAKQKDLSPGESDCSCSGAFNPNCPAHGTQESRPRTKANRILSAKDLSKTAGIGVFQPAMYRGREVMLIAIDNTGSKATVQEGKKQFIVPLSDLTETANGPYTEEPRLKGK